MNILIFSDTHGDTEKMYDIVSKNRLKTDLVIHLGDYLKDAGEVMRNFSTIAFLGVLGNCDFASMYADAKHEAFFTAEKVRIFYTHGHKYNVNYGNEYLASNAKFNGCKIALYGHTHVALNEEINGVTVINPGSISSPRDGSCGTYAYLTVDGENFKCEILEVE